jgi:hypothetical protein
MPAGSKLQAASKEKAMKGRSIADSQIASKKETGLMNHANMECKGLPS